MVYRPLLRDPGRILGIGLNYRDHAADLNETVPYGIPGSFMKPRTALIGQGDRILIPRASERTTAEGELALVFGRRTGPSDPLGDGKGWLDVVAGFTTVLDMTAEDILRRNPRYLTLSKGFDTFLSLGPHLITPDEIDDVNALEVATVKNGDIVARNRVDRMTFSPERLVRYHTEIMTWEPGDILSTGHPRRHAHRPRRPGGVPGLRARAPGERGGGSQGHRSPGDGMIVRSLPVALSPHDERPAEGGTCIWISD